MPDMTDDRPWQQPTLTDGPAPTGRDKVFDSIYGWLGGKPENRWAADKLTDVATLGGMAPWTAAYDGGRELAETGRPAALATALIPGARVAAPVAKVAEKAAERGIRAFHGSPHDFDRFDLSKIGTGEGAQAYGHGLYFAEAEDTAKHYRYGIGKNSPEGQLADRLIQEAGGDKKKAMAAAYSQLPMSNLQETQNALRILDYIQHGTKGRMYEVNIKADPADFFDWDKPVTEQTGKVAEAIKPLLSKPVGDAKQLSEKLKQAGIPGVKYLDQGSRAAGEGSRNYVVFDDALIDIVRKYGIAGLLAAYYGGNSSPADAKEQRD